MSITIDYDSAHRLVTSRKNLFWEGWTIIDWTPNDEAFYKKNGMFRNGRWGIAKRYEPNGIGWSVPNKYAERLV